MTLAELDRALRQLRLSGMADGLEARLRQAQAERLVPLDLVATLVTDELVRRQDRLLARRRTQARFRDPGKTLDTFDFDFNRKVDRALVFTLATGRFIAAHEDALFLGPPGTGKSHLAQAIGHAAIQQGYRVRYAEAHGLLDELAEATIDGTRRAKMTELATVPLLIIASSSVTPPPSAPCSIASSTTPTSSSAGRAAGGCATTPCPLLGRRSKSDHDIRAVAIGRF